MGWQSTVWSPTVWAVGVWVCDTSAPAPARPYPGPAGGVSKGRRSQKRKPWIIGDKRIVATREELEAILADMLTAQRPAEVEAAPEQAPAAQPKVAPKDKAIVAAFPNYPDLRDMLLAAQQIEAAQALRAVALRLADEEDERDVELLLMHS